MCHRSTQSRDYLSKSESIRRYTTESECLVFDMEDVRIWIFVKLSTIVLAIRYWIVTSSLLQTQLCKFILSSNNVSLWGSILIYIYDIYIYTDISQTSSEDHACMYGLKCFYQRYSTLGYICTKKYKNTKQKHWSH